MNSLAAELLILLDDETIEFKSFIEFMALGNGIKKVVRLVVDKVTYPVIDRFCKNHGIGCLRSDFWLKHAFSTSLLDRFYEIAPSGNPDTDCFVIFCGDRDFTTKACLIETNGCNAEKTAEIYGYPKCCAQNYQRIQNGEHWLAPYLENTAHADPHSWLNNKIAYLFPPHLTIFPDYFPCSIDCKETSQLAQLYADMLTTAGFDNILNIIRRVLKLPILVFEGHIYQFTNLNFQSGRWLNQGAVNIFPYLANKTLSAPLKISVIHPKEEKVIEINASGMRVEFAVHPGSSDFITFS